MFGSVFFSDDMVSKVRGGSGLNVGVNTTKVIFEQRVPGCEGYCLLIGPESRKIGGEG